MSNKDRKFFTRAMLENLEETPPMPNLFWKVVLRFRNFIGRDRYYVCDETTDGFYKARWCVGRKDVVTGSITIVDEGEGPIPKKWSRLEGKK